MDNGKLKILFVSAEVSPFAKTGGLADVAGSLPRALIEMGHDVRVVMPKYRQIQANFKYAADFPVKLDNQVETCVIRKTELTYKSNNAKRKQIIYFTDSYKYFDRDGIYGHYDDAERFIFFCMSVLEMLPRIDFQPDIIHCNDWHTGPLCLLLKERYGFQEFYKHISTIYTIHNLEYQGNFSSYVLNLLNLGYEIFNSDKAEFYGMFSFMKTGLVYADIISTVSAVYAQEIQTPQYGERLEGLLAKRSDDLYGILNGISYEEFNPETDQAIAKKFNADDYKAKKENKYALQKEMGLPVSDVPVIGLISRLSGQKGLNLIIEQIDDILGKDLQFVLLGAGDDYYQDHFRRIAARYPGKIAIHIGFNARLAQQIYAGSDMFLMPSRFEPCGLGQIISLRYGTIPIVRATGGLAETITDYDSDHDRGNGFSFNQFSSTEMLDAVERCLKLYGKPDEWSKLVVRALNTDFSWEVSAKKYEDLYLHAVEKRNEK